MIRINRLYQQLRSLHVVPRMALTKEEAAFRSAHLKSPAANTLHIELLRGKQYRAVISSEFETAIPSQDLFLDYQGAKVASILLNGHNLDCSRHADNKIYLPAQYLSTRNNIIIAFENSYSTSGHGLHSFVDSNDEQYVYSQCEPFHASKIFPCFDQPDIKATFTLVAYHPSNWTVISNEKPNLAFPHSLQPIYDLGYFRTSNDYKITAFHPTKAISTYLCAILAGEYAEIKAPQHLLHNNIPQSLFCRKAHLPYLQKDAQHIFRLIKEGTSYFENLFLCPYPFSKYDQIFCPEYSTGAMENAGAVTLNDLYVFKEPVQMSQWASRDNTIIHELSHMWFGDLVTMKWWDDLWLNESFAEFISHLCQSEIQKGPVNHWVQFLERKLWGYTTDEKSTTHPIYCDVQNTDQAENIFDGITYAKGAALLKQIYFLMDRTQFTQSMGMYFNQFQFSNATLQDFFKSMQHVNNVDWDTFRKDWIMTSGFNTLSYSISGCHMHVVQEGSYLRNHALKIGILNEGKAITSQHIKVEKDRAIQTFSISGLTDSSIVILNYDDECYVKVRYEAKQTAALLQHLKEIPESLNRLVILYSIFDQVREGKTCYREFGNAMNAYLPLETDDTVIKLILQWCQIGISAYTPQRLRHEQRERLADLLERMLSQANDKNRLLTLRSHYISLCRSRERLSKLDINDLGIKDGWQMVYNTYLYDRKRPDLLESVAQKDSDKRRHERFIRALEERERLWEYFVSYSKEESLQLVAQAMRAYNHERFVAELERSEAKFFEVIASIFESKEQEYAKTFYANLYPISDNLRMHVEKSEELLKRVKNDFLIKLLKDSIDINLRRLRAYETYG